MCHEKKCGKLSQTEAMSGQGRSGKKELHNEEERLCFENCLGKQEELLVPMMHKRPFFRGVIKNSGRNEALPGQLRDRQEAFCLPFCAGRQATPLRSCL